MLYEYKDFPSSAIINSKILKYKNYVYCLRVVNFF